MGGFMAAQPVAAVGQGWSPLQQIAAVAGEQIGYLVGGFGPIGRLQFLHDVPNVNLHGALAHVELVGDDLDLVTLVRGDSIPRRVLVGLNLVRGRELPAKLLELVSCSPTRSYPCNKRLARGPGSCYPYMSGMRKNEKI